MASFSVHFWYISKTYIFMAILPFNRLDKILIFTILCHFGLRNSQMAIDMVFLCIDQKFTGKLATLLKTKAYLNYFCQNLGNFLFIFAVFFHLLTSSWTCPNLDLNYNCKLALKSSKKLALKCLNCLSSLMQSEHGWPGSIQIPDGNQAETIKKLKQKCVLISFKNYLLNVSNLNQFWGML